MFFELLLLRRQNDSRFAISWTASTRGIQSVCREFGVKKVVELDIALLCEEIMEYMRSSSINPNERLSLRMAVHLIQGTILIFNKQVSFLQDELITIITTAPRPLPPSPRVSDLISKMPVALTPPTPIIKVKRPRKKHATKELSAAVEEFIRAGVPQDIAEMIEGVAPLETVFVPLQSRSDLHQIIDDLPLKVTLMQDDFGELNVMDIPFPKLPSEVGAEKSQLERIEEILIADEQKEREEVKSKPSTYFKKSTSSSSPDEAPQLIKVTAMVHRPQEEQEVLRISEIIQEPELIKEQTITKHVDVIQEHEIIAEQVITEDIEKAPVALKRKNDIISSDESVPKARRVLRELQSDEIVQKRGKKSLEISEEGTDRKLQIRPNLICKVIKGKKILHLNSNEKLYVLPESRPAEHYNQLKAYSDFNDYIMLHFSKLAHTALDYKRKVDAGQYSNLVIADSLLRTSKETPRISSLIDASIGLTKKSVEETAIPSTKDFMAPIEVEVVASTPIRSDLDMPQKKLYEETRIEIEPPLYRGKTQVPEFLFEEPLIEELVEGPKVPEYVESPKVPTSKRETLLSEEERRRQMIIQTVREWDIVQDLTVDYLIPLPKIRRNAAITFSDLLALAKDGYVKLLPYENSLEIKSVEKGQLLLTQEKTIHKK